MRVRTDKVSNIGIFSWVAATSHGHFAVAAYDFFEFAAAGGVPYGLGRCFPHPPCRGVALYGRGFFARERGCGFDWRHQEPARAFQEYRFGRVRERGFGAG